MTDSVLEEILKDNPPEIDDEEFGIKECEALTLESILQEDEEQQRELDRELLPVPELTDVASVSSCDSSGLSTLAPTLSSGNASMSPKATPRLEALRRTGQNSRKALTDRLGGLSNSVLKRGLLASVSTQLRASKAKMGSPTCIAFAYYIAVGTSHGLAFIYDAKQVMKWCLGDPDRAAEVGAVSCLTFNADSSRLLVGHARGLVTMWDATSGKLLRRITDAHPPGHAVLFLRFTDDPTLALLVNSGGSVFQLEFKRSIKGRSCDSSCLFSGCRGEICCLEPLLQIPSLVDHPVYQFRLVAMASFTKVFALSLRGHMAVKYTQALPGNAATLPLLAWFWPSGEAPGPILAFARDANLHLLQLSARGRPGAPAELLFRPLQQLTFDFTLLAIHWMAPKTMALLDTKEQMHLVDLPSEEELEVSDLSTIGLCYNSSLYKALATGGNVSELLAYAGESACYHSMCVGDGQLVVLGVKSLHCLTIRTWKERLSTLCRRGRPDLAVQFMSDLLLGRAKAAKGLPRDPAGRKQEVTREARLLLTSCVPLANQAWGEQADCVPLWQALAKNCVELELSLAPESSSLNESLFSCFDVAGPHASGPFLEALLPLVAARRITSLPPALIQRMVEYSQESGRLREMEAAIVHLDAANLDLDQLVRLCKRHDLFDALIHIYGAALRDFRGPMEDMCQLLGERMQDRRPEDELWPSELGNKLLVYISGCLGGRSYVSGEPLDDEIAPSVQQMAFDFLMTSKGSKGEPFPHLTTLLLFNTKDFLNVLALAFAETPLCGNRGRAKRQLAVDSLVECMTKQQQGRFTAAQVGSLFVFIARQLVRPENAALRFDAATFDQVLEWLCQAEPARGAQNMAQLAEQQQVIVDLLTAHEAVPSGKYNSERLLVMAQRVQFYSVMEFLYRKDGRYADMVTCYLDDPMRKDQVFSFIKWAQADNDVSQEQKIAIKELCLERIKDLADINAEKTVSLLIKTLHEKIETMVPRLRTQPYTLFLLLRGYFHFSGSRASSPQSDAQTADPTDGPRAIDPVVSERFIELMVEFDTSELELFLRQDKHYRTAAAIQLVQQCDEPKALAFLYEKSGKFSAALEIFIKLFDAAFAPILASNERSDMTGLAQVERAFKEAVSFCQKNCAGMDGQGERERLWFPLLDSVLAKQRQLGPNQPDLTDFIKALAQSVISAMSPHISVPAILQRILQDPLYAHEKMADLKGMILSMLVTFNYESTLLGTCCRLVETDLVRAWSQYVESGQRGFGPRKYRCELCRWALCGANAGGAPTGSEEEPAEEAEEETERMLIMFRCGHGFHASCLLRGRSYIGLRSDPEWLCPLCALPSNRNSAPPGLLRAVSVDPAAARGAPSTALLAPIAWERLQSLRESAKPLRPAEVLRELAESARAERDRAGSAMTSSPFNAASNKGMKPLLEACSRGLDLRAPSIFDD